MANPFNSILPLAQTKPPSPRDISTLQKRGHLYFALTAVLRACYLKFKSELFKAET